MALTFGLAIGRRLHGERLGAKALGNLLSPSRLISINPRPRAMD
jgi:hypothetical protein